MGKGMDADSGMADIVDVINELSQVPFDYTNRAKALKRITQLGRRALGSRACTLTSVSAANKLVEQLACDADDPDLERHLAGKRTRLGASANGDHLALELIAGGRFVEKYHLSDNGQGVANPRVAARYGLRALLAYRLQVGDETIGYFCHFSSTATPFSGAERKLVESSAVTRCSPSTSWSGTARSTARCPIWRRCPDSCWRRHRKSSCTRFPKPPAISWTCQPASSGGWMKRTTC